MNETRVGTALRAGTKALAESGIDSAPRDARLLMAHVLTVLPERMTLHVQDEISPENLATFQKLVAERTRRRPVAQIIGQRQFYGRSFAVTADVLDPRGDTETLVEAALGAPFENVLDLGTGSGCILLSLLAERPSARGVGTDVSAGALAVAARNAEALGVAKRVEFILSDWFDAVDGTYDLIVSNPPYIATDEMAHLQPELAYEPRKALTDEADGLSAYRVICAHAPRFLRTGGRLMLEIGARQAADVAALMVESGFADVRLLQDLEGRDRVLWSRKSA